MSEDNTPSKRRQAKNKPKSKTRTIYIPAADKSTFDWIDAQDYPSLSIRMLIHKDIEENGYTDINCRPKTRQITTDCDPPQSIQSQEGRLLSKSPSNQWRLDGLETNDLAIPEQQDDLDISDPEEEIEILPDIKVNKSSVLDSL